MRVSTPLALGDVVHERRRELGLTQGQLATRMGVSRRWVNEFENGKGTAQVGLVFDALSVLGLSLHASADDDA